MLLQMRYPIDGDLTSLLAICVYMEDKTGLLSGLADSGVDPGSQSMGFYGLKFNVVGAALSVVRFGNTFAWGIFSTIGTIFRDWS